MALIRNLRFAAAAAFTAVVGFAAPVLADSPPRHVRGTLSEISGEKAVVATAGGKSDTVKINDKTLYFVVSATDFSAITANKFVGVTSIEKDGKRVAREVHVFAEALRGLGEGHYPWDLENDPNMMTNANIGKVETVGNDRVIKLDYKGGEQVISVPANCAIVAFDKAAAADMKTGSKTFVIATPADDAAGSSAILVVVGKDGLKPPF